MADLWQYDEPISSYEHEDHETPEVPAWIERDITPADVKAIVQGGCDSGAYMPAVTYYQALATMKEHEDAVLDSIEETTGDDFAATLAQAQGSSAPPTSWSALACFFVSRAVEAWAATVEGPLSDLLDAIEETKEAATP